MWKNYKAAIITGAVFCCIIFFGLGYCVGNSGRGGRGCFQSAGNQTIENGNQGMRRDERNHMGRPNDNNSQAPSGDEDQNNDGSQTTPDTNNGSQTTPDTNNGSQTLPDNNTGSLDGMASPSSFFYGEIDVF